MVDLDRFKDDNDVHGHQAGDRLRGAPPGEQACSPGLATWDREEGIDHLVGRADRALYAAKQGGRDRTVSG